MYPVKNRNKGAAGPNEEQNPSESLLLDDDWAGYGPDDKARSRKQEDNDMEISDESLLIL